MYNLLYQGYLKGHPWPKVTAGVFIGFIAGKFSYKSQCEEKIMRLSGGKLKEALIRSKRSSDGTWSGSMDDSG